MLQKMDAHFSIIENRDKDVTVLRNYRSFSSFTYTSILESFHDCTCEQRQNYSDWLFRRRDSTITESVVVTSLMKPNWRRVVLVETTVSHVRISVVPAYDTQPVLYCLYLSHNISPFHLVFAVVLRLVQVVSFLLFWLYWFAVVWDCTFFSCCHYRSLLV